MWGAETPALRKLAMRVLSKVTCLRQDSLFCKPCKAVSQTLHGCRCPVLVPVSATGSTYDYIDNKRRNCVSSAQCCRLVYYFTNR